MFHQPVLCWFYGETFRQKTAILRDFFDPEGWLQSRTHFCPSSAGSIFLCDVTDVSTIGAVAKFTLRKSCVFSFLATDGFYVNCRADLLGGA